MSPSIFAGLGGPGGPAGPDENPDEGPDIPTCSARDCRAPAVWALRWNNPRLHTPERRKVWLACDVHRKTLGDFLGARGFLKDVVAYDEVG